MTEPLQAFRIHIAVNIAIAHLGVQVPACDGPDCEVCKAITAALAGEGSPVSPAVLQGVIDARCGCESCRARTENIYRQVSRKCANCGAGPFLILYREGDNASPQDCPRCRAGYKPVSAYRPATDDEIPAAAEPVSPTGAEQEPYDTFNAKAWMRRALEAEEKLKASSAPAAGEGWQALEVIAEYVLGGWTRLCATEAEFNAAIGEGLRMSPVGRVTVQRPVSASPRSEEETT